MLASPLVFAGIWHRMSRFGGVLFDLLGYGRRAAANDPGSSQLGSLYNYPGRFGKVFLPHDSFLVIEVFEHKTTVMKLLVFGQAHC